MPEDREELYYKVNLICAHCGHTNQVAHSDFKSSMLGNHFYKLACQKDGCLKRTMITYSYMGLKYDFGEVPEKTLSKISIPTIV